LTCSVLSTSLKLNLEAYAPQMDSSVLWDWAWANRMVWTTAEIVAFAFSTDKSQSRLQDLKRNTEEWYQQKPDSFRPLYVARGAVFPEIHFVRPWHGEHPGNVKTRPR
jgi:hypothetical protein